MSVCVLSDCWHCPHSMLLMAHSILHHVSHNQGSVWGIFFLFLFPPFLCPFFFFLCFFFLFRFCSLLSSFPFFSYVFFFYSFSPLAPGLERAFQVKPKRREAAFRLKAQGTMLPLKTALKGMLQCTAGCAEDCLMILDQCPIPSGGTLCSGVGWCLSTQGICQCYLGYAGDDCSSCDEGYVRYGPALLP